MRSVELSKKARLLSAKLRKAGKYSTTMICDVLEEVYSSGYTAGSEYQMMYRLKDKKEHEEQLSRLRGGAR